MKPFSTEVQQTALWLRICLGPVFENKELIYGNWDAWLLFCRQRRDRKAVIRNDKSIQENKNCIYGNYYHATIVRFRNRG